MSGDWYCRNCGYLSAGRVTFSETCDECHIPVEWHEEGQMTYIEELEADRARLAWLASSGGRVVQSSAYSGFRCWVEYTVYDEEGPHCLITKLCEDWRDALDEAMRPCEEA